MEQPKLNLISLDKMLRETNARIDKLAGVVENLAAQVSAVKPVDEAVVIEKVQAALARQFLPNIEALQNNMKSVMTAVAQDQANLDVRIQKSVQAVFELNKDAIKEAINAKFAENGSPAPGEPAAGQPANPAAARSTLGGIGSIINTVFAAAQAYPEGAKTIFGLFRPTPPPTTSILMDQLATSFKTADAILKMQRAVADGKDVDTAIATAKAGLTAQKIG